MFNLQVPSLIWNRSTLTSTQSTTSTTESLQLIVDRKERPDFYFEDDYEASGSQFEQDQKENIIHNSTEKSNNFNGHSPVKIIQSFLHLIFNGEIGKNSTVFSLDEFLTYNSFIGKSKTKS